MGGEARDENDDYCADFGKIMLPSEKAYHWFESVWEGVAGRQEEKSLQESLCGRNTSTSSGITTIISDYKLQTLKQYK